MRCLLLFTIVFGAGANNGIQGGSLEKTREEARESLDSGRKSLQSRDF
jgi:hypothetical protein